MPKAEFQAVLERQGLRDVVVYINSGNAVAEGDELPSSNAIQRALEHHFGFSIPTLVLSGDHFQRIARQIPDQWTNDPPQPDKSGNKSDVLFLFPSANTADILERIGYKPDVETMEYVDGAVITTITRKNQGRGSLQKIAGTALYHDVTIRNINTVRKLAALVG